jgi:adenosine deaminase
MADRRTLIEVCLTSNLQTHPGMTLEKHPLPLFLQQRQAVCICTDNRLFS